MAHYDHGMVLPFIAASVVGQGVAVAMPIASAASEKVVPQASPGFLGEPVGITIATVASVGYEAAVVISGVAKARAAASVGAGARVGAASSNGALGPVLASGVLASNGASAGLALPRWSVGYAKTSAAAGEYFSVVVDPRQVI